MLTDFQEIKWEQNGSQLVLFVPAANNTQVKILVDDKIINFLASNTPKIYFLFTEMANDPKEHCYLLNLEGIKSTVSLENSLKVKVGKQADAKNFDKLTRLGKYCIARGESYYERFIAEKGWQHQRKYFDIYAFEQLISFLQQKDLSTRTDNKITKTEPEKEIPVKPKIEIKEQKAETSLKAGGKLKECKFCKEIFPGNMDVCPYCNKNQNEAAAEEDIDISI